MLPFADLWGLIILFLFFSSFPLIALLVELYDLIKLRPSGYHERNRRINAFFVELEKALQMEEGPDTCECRACRATSDSGNYSMSAIEDDAVYGVYDQM